MKIPDVIFDMIDLYMVKTFTHIQLMIEEFDENPDRELKQEMIHVCEEWLEVVQFVEQAGDYDQEYKESLKEMKQSILTVVQVVKERPVNKKKKSKQTKIKRVK